jgi:hypothetical protein
VWTGERYTTITHGFDLGRWQSDGKSPPLSFLSPTTRNLAGVPTPTCQDCAGPSHQFFFHFLSRLLNSQIPIRLALQFCQTHELSAQIQVSISNDAHFHMSHY